MVKPDLANLITMSRIVGVAGIFWLTPFVSEIIQVWTIIIYTIIGFTDFLDGWIARKFNIVSDLGKVLDPLADKILVLVFLPLLSMGAITAFPVFIILAREFGIMGIRVFAAKHGYIISANISGKIKTAITLPVCGILMARPIVIESASIPWGLVPLTELKRWVHVWPYWVFDALIWTTVAVTVWSFLDYLARFLWVRQLTKCKGDKALAKKAVLSYVPNSVSFINFCCGLIAILCCINGALDVASALILLGMILDGLDGRIARWLGVDSSLGEKLDSRADYTTFGVAPAFLLYNYIHQLTFLNISTIAWVVSVLYFMAVYFRLKRFEKKGHGTNFEGIPAPVGAALVAVTTSSFMWSYPIVFIGINLVNIALMASTLAYPHNNATHTKWGFSMLRVPVLIYIALVILADFFVSTLNQFYIKQTLLGLMTIYYAAPIIPNKRPK